MTDRDRQESNDRHLVPADEIQRWHIVRDDIRDPPTVGIFDEPLRCYPVNEEWAKHIMGAVAVLSFWTAWTGSQDDRNTAVQEILEFMIGEVCSMFLLRQNTTNPCLLEQSIDGGTIWMPAFDFSLCMMGGSTATISFYIDVAIQNINTLNLAYIDAGLDITIMYPNLEYDSSPTDDDRNTALCYAFEALTEGIFNAVEHQINLALNRTNFLSQLIQTLSGGFWASNGSLLQSLSLAITDAIFGTAALQAASDALANTTARRNVVCCLYENMEGSTATFALWGAAGTGCGFTPGSDEDLLLDILTPLFAGLDAYLAWVTLLSEGVDLAINDVIGNDCLSCGGWIAHIDFTASDGGYVWDWDRMDTDYGVYVPGTGWQADTKPAGSAPGWWATACVLKLDFTGGGYTLTKSTLYFDYTLGDWNAAPQLAQRISRGTDHTGVNQGDTSDGTGQTLATSVTPVAGCVSHWLFIRSSFYNSASHDFGNALLTGVDIEGTGAIPPELLPFIV